MLETITMLKADLRRILEERVGDKDTLQPPPRLVEVRSVKEPYLPELPPMNPCLRRELFPPREE
ncbi:UNVERIFIED_CONTAM: hypothetical protein Sradi_3211400 [Sesamum radiatum]|uniref:Uncharacterized protein n=1 Tax=Sesamum radiatum TaxID=300843 RepID=A0AAW2RGA6_SESRA